MGKRLAVTMITMCCVLQRFESPLVLDRHADLCMAVSFCLLITIPIIGKLFKNKPKHNNKG